MVSGHNPVVKNCIWAEKVVVIRKSKVVVFVKLFVRKHIVSRLGLFEVVVIARWSSKWGGR